jgi:predicted phage tail protein
VFWLSNSGVADASDNNFRVADSAPANQPPAVSLSAPANGATFTAPASITVSATASDSDGTIARVDFYQGPTLIGTDTTSPYSITWSNVPAGSYTLTARAVDNSGGTTASTARTVTVATTSSTKSVVFTASPDHTTQVTSYLLEIFPAGVETSATTPLASQDLGKPPVVNGECTVDMTGTIDALAPGTYQLTITAVGDGGRSQSMPFSFTR